MNTESKLRLQAFLDNEVSSGEGRQIASWIARDPEARALFDELKATRALVCENEPVVTLPATRDFYWSQIQRRIATAEREAAPAEADAAPRSWWLRMLAPATALAAVALFAVTTFTPPSRSLAHVEKSHTDESITFYSPEHRMTVVWIPSGQQQQVADASFDDFE